ncbi:hypothetical protein B0H14DRAFT_3126074 [Mycena olivaceomarginata]|nr:hypothetical protein B0H14DRAFT_3126074 [Mycena olivaceomarginata]
MSETKFLREITDIIGREPGWQEEHIPLRLLGNVACQPNTDLGTLGQFFDAHDRIRGNNTKKILQGPPTLRLPSPAVYLEGFISVKDFEDSTGVLAPYFVHTEKENRKRKSSQSSRPMTPDLGSLKRSRTQISAPVPLRSEFGDLPEFSKVPFLFASVSIATNGAVTIAWPNLDDEICAPSICLLQDAAFDQGKTKKVHKVIHDGLPWVAKRFFNIGTGEGLVEIQDNYDQITKEGIKVTEFKLGVELIPNGSGPSIASEFSMEQYEAAQLDGSAQAATVVNENGGGVQVLFDIMTHTLNGLSGVGDHGKSGITGFLKKHECGNRCHNLRLSCDGFDCDEPSHEASENEA